MNAGVYKIYFTAEPMYRCPDARSMRASILVAKVK